MREARGPHWTDWLHEHGIVGLTGVDTRSLVLHLRDRGAMRAAAVSDASDVDEVLTAVRTQPEMAGAALVAGVSTRRAVHLRRRRALCASRSSTTAASARSCAGSRANGAAVDVFPHDVDADTLAGVRRRAALAGAGRPRTARRGGADGRETCSGAHRCSASVSVISCSRSRPVTETFKLPFGHRGANHPVLDHRSNQVLVTSQNHGFAVAAGDDTRVTHTSLYDGTVEGLDYPS